MLIFAIPCMYCVDASRRASYWGSWGSLFCPSRRHSLTPETMPGLLHAGESRRESRPQRICPSNASSRSLWAQPPSTSRFHIGQRNRRLHPEGKIRCPPALCWWLVAAFLPARLWCSTRYHRRCKSSRAHEEPFYRNAVQCHGIWGSKVSRRFSWWKRHRDSRRFLWPHPAIFRISAVKCPEDSAIFDCAPVVRGRTPSIVKKVFTVCTPGETVAAVVTEAGIALNPRHRKMCIRDRY